MNDIHHNILYKLLTSKRFLLILGAIIVPLLLLPVWPDKLQKFDPFLIFYLIAGVFLLGIFVMKKSLQYYVLPYFLLQYVVIFIFFDKKYLGAVGLNLKFYGMVFVLGVVMSAFYLFKHFRYLWDNFIIFRCFLIFFVFNIICFLLGHYSNFRLRGDDMFLIKQAMVNLGQDAMLSTVVRDFSEEAKLSIYINSFVPITSIMVSLMAFYGVKTREDIKERLVKIIKFSTILSIIFYAGSFLSIALGLSIISFSSGRILGNFLGATSNLGYIQYLSIFLLMFIAFRFFIQKIQENNPVKYPKLLIGIDILIFLNFLFVFGHMSKGNVLALACSFLLIFYFIMKIDKGLIPFMKGGLKTNAFQKVMFCAFALLAAFLVFKFLNFEQFMFKLYERVTNNETFATRVLHWIGFMSHWADNLTLPRFIFGYGLDSSMDLTFNLSNSMARERGLTTIHNTFLGTFYETGLMSLVYFAGIFSTSVSSIKNLFLEKADSFLKIVSTMNLSVIVFILILWLSVDSTMPTRITLFCAIGFLESLKYAYSSAMKEKAA